MRLRLRAASLLALAAAALSCTDAPTAPGTTQPGTFRAARLRVSPSFSPAAARAYASLADMGVQLTMVRMRLVNAGGTVVTDTTISFPADQDTLMVSLPVQIQGAEQSFAATIELRDAKGRVFFARTQQVTARDASLPAALAPTIELLFVGPGASARTMTVSPATGTIIPGALPELVASAADSAGLAVADLLVAKWTSSDTTIATVTATTSTAATVHGTGRRGVATITATTLGGVTASAQLTFLPQPAQLALVGEATLAGPAGHELPQPFIVQLLGVDGLGISNQRVTFRGVTAGGQVATASATTDVEGKARTAITPGRTPGKFVFEATSGTLSATLEVRAVTGAPSQLRVTQPLPASLRVGEAPPLPFQGHLADDMGNAVQKAGVAVTAAVTVAPGGQSFSVSATSDSTGDVSIALPAYVGAIGSATITLSSPLLGTIGTTTIPVEPGAAVSFHVVQQPAPIAASGAPLVPAPQVQLVDLGGNPVAGTIPVTVALSDGLVGTLGGTTTVTTDAAGRATFDGLTIVGMVGRVTLRFDGSSYTGVTSDTITLVAGAAERLTIEIQPSANVESGLPFPRQPLIGVRDGGGNLVMRPGITVDVVIASGVGTLTGGSATTDASGLAYLSGLALSGTPGPFTLAFRSGALSVTSAPIDLALPALGPVSHFHVMSGEGQSAIVTTLLPQTIVVEAHDSNHRPVPDVPMSVNFTGDQGYVLVNGVNYGCDCFVADSINTDASGQASFTWTLGNRAKVDTLSIENATVTATTVTAMATAGPPTQLLFDSASALSTEIDNVLSPFTVRVSDVGGVDTLTAERGDVTLTLIGGDGVAQTGTMTRPLVNGVATFDDIAIHQLGNFNFTATSGTLTGQSVAFDISARVPPQFSVVSGDDQTGVVGTDLAQPLVIRVTDRLGNPLPGIAMLVEPANGGTVAITGGAYPNTRRDSVTSDAAGEVTFRWRMPSLAGATSAMLSNYEGSSLTVNATALAGAPATLTFPAQPTNAAVGTPPSVVMVLVTDAGGNPVAGQMVTLTLTGGTTPPPLGGTTSVRSDAAGIAAFPDLAVGVVGTRYGLGAQAGGLYAASASFDVTPPPPAAIAAEGTGHTLARNYGVGLTQFIVKDANTIPLPMLR